MNKWSWVNGVRLTKTFFSVSKESEKILGIKSYAESPINGLPGGKILARYKSLYAGGKKLKNYLSHGRQFLTSLWQEETLASWSKPDLLKERI